MITAQIYTDGSCMPNPGKGGWAFVILIDDKIIYKDQGCELETTSNRMEMMAAIQALRTCNRIYKKNIYIILYSDSQLLINTMLSNWKKFKNQDLWFELIELTERLTLRGIVVDWRWVKAHVGNKYNEVVDGMANRSAQYQIQSENVVEEIVKRESYNFYYQSKREKNQLKNTERIGQLSFV